MNTHTHRRMTNSVIRAQRRGRVNENAVPNNTDGASDQHASVATIATFWQTEPESQYGHEELIEHARISLGKYDLEPEQLDEAAPLLARALHMRIEQNGGQDLDPAHKRAIEMQVLDWLGFASSPNNEQL